MIQTHLAGCFYILVSIAALLVMGAGYADPKKVKATTPSATDIRTVELVAQVRARCKSEGGTWLDFLNEKTSERIVGCIWSAPGQPEE